MFTTRPPPLKTYSRQKKRPAVELERGHANDKSSSSGSSNSNDGSDIEEGNNNNNSNKRMKRRRIGCVSGTGNVRPVSAVSKVSPAMKSSSAIRSGSCNSELSECAHPATQRSFLQSSLSSSSSSSLLLSSSSPRLGDYDSTMAMTLTPPSSPPPLTASSSLRRVDHGCKGGASVLSESECKAGGGLSRYENASFSSKAVTVTSTSTSDTIKANPLAPRSANIPSKLLSSKPKPQAIPKKRKSRPQLTQLCIDLGNDVRRTCKICGMDYIASNAEDIALHKKFHRMIVGGIDVPKWFVDESRPKKLQKESGDGDGNGAPVTIVAVDRRDSFAARNVATRVVDVANRELSAVQIDDAELWGRVVLDHGHGDKRGGVFEKKGSLPGTGMGIEAQRDAAPLKREQRESDDKGADRYKVYLYLRGQKCVGLCLVERISKAYRVISAERTKKNEPSNRISDVSSISAPDTLSGTLSALPLASTSISHASLDETPRPAIMGISRIWTSHSHRRKGIARNLLDCAATSFLYGMTVGQNSIAFSQPTESGSQLARNWFGELDGWHVYT